MNYLINVRAFAGLLAAAMITGTILTGFYQSTTRLPSQWPISLNGATLTAQKLA
jgi:hypothetical protein